MRPVLLLPLNFALLCVSTTPPVAASSGAAAPEAPLARSVPLSRAAYGDNFDTFASSNASSTTPNGWAFVESDTNANTTYTAGTGNSNTGDTYSFGAASANDRAFGGLRSGSLIPMIGALFTNNTSLLAAGAVALRRTVQ